VTGPYVVDETNGPGRRMDALDNALQEIYWALGNPVSDKRIPTLDEVLLEIRNLRDGAEVQDDVSDPVEYVPQSALALPSVSYGAFGMTIMGFSAEDVLRIRQAYREEGKS
jgi:hypothetical protein